MTKIRTSAAWIQTNSGGRFYPLEPRVCDVKLFDIAHALSNICRFNGHCKAFYSVAQHSVLVSRAVSKEDRLWGLLHDASEAYICDIPRPLKRDPEFANYCEVETRVMKIIMEAFGLPAVMPTSVKIADGRMLATEARDLMPNREVEVWRPLMINPYHDVVKPWTPKQSYKAFMEQFDKCGSDSVYWDETRE